MFLHPPTFVIFGKHLRDMRSELRAFADPLDKCVHAAEWRCAQFISAMRPIFGKYDIVMPSAAHASFE